jgi:signal transduction histidine kinase/DNA-binding NarL/FixJ family response regulator
MRVRVVTAQDAGVVVAAEGATPEEFWLPSSAWNEPDPREWKHERLALTPGETLDVTLVVSTPPFNQYRVVSRSAYHSVEADDGWQYQVRTLRVESSTDKAIVGWIGAVQAFADAEPYTEFLKNRVLQDWAADHSTLGRGDYIGGIVQTIDNNSGSVVLDTAQLLESLLEQSRETPLAGPDRSNDVGNEAAPPTLPVLPEEVRKTLDPVLLIEDDRQLGLALAELLQQFGLSVGTAGDIEQARKKLAEDGFRLVLIDANLKKGESDKNGFALLETQTKPGRRVVLLTGEPPSATTLNRWGDLRIHGYLRKPCTPHELAEALCVASLAPGKPWGEFEPREEAANENPQDNPPAEEDPHPAASASKVSMEVSLEGAIAELARFEPGAVIHVFEMHPRSFRARSLACNGGNLNWIQYRGKLGKSVVKDTAIDGWERLERDPLDPKRHFWTLQMMKYRSFMGMPIIVPSARRRFALVAFHGDSTALGPDFQWRARICAERVGRALERKQLQISGEQQSRFAATGMALESLAHEIKNDIQRISFRAPQLTTQALANDLGQVQRLSALITEFAAEANEKTRLLTGSLGDKDRVNVQNCLRIAANRCRAVVDRTIQKPDRIVIEAEVAATGGEWHVWAAPAALTILFFNLYLNAAQQIDMMARTGIRAGGKVWHTYERQVDDKGDATGIVRIHDTGPGVHREDWDVIFTPGYTTREAGTGLGLHICRQLAKGIGGRGKRASLTVARSTIWGGTTFAVTLPLEPILIERKTG